MAFFGVFLSWATLSLPVWGGTPELTRILDSSLGRAIFKSTEGQKLSEALMGRSLSSGVDMDLLIGRLSLQDPDTLLLKVRLEEQVSKIESELRQSGNINAEDLENFKLNPDQSKILKKLITRYLTLEELGEAEKGSLRFVELAESTEISNAAQKFLRGDEAGAGILPADILGSYKRTQALYDQIKKLHPKIQVFMPDEAVGFLLADVEMPDFVLNLEKVLEAVKSDRTHKSLSSKLETAFLEILEGEVPAETISSRIKALFEGGADFHILRRALGEMTLEEVQLKLHGGNPLKPTPESLLGQYIKSTGAATVVRSFPKYATNGCKGGSSGQGPKRLVVALSQQSLSEYLRLLKSKDYLVHVHTPQQGTLFVAFNGRTGAYGRLAATLRLPSSETIMPHILLSSTEGQRADQFFRLAGAADVGGYSSNGAALRPWLLGEQPNVPANPSLVQSVEYYCKKGGYDNCTSWFQNIPVGDRFVNEYHLPGALDSYASNKIGKKPVVTPLNLYEHPNPLAHQVWKAPYGNEQLAEILDLRKESDKAELVNPGWVAVSLTGPAGVDRVPVVFYVVADHRLPIPKDFDPKIDPK